MGTITIDTYRPNLSPGELDSAIDTIVQAQRRCEWLLCRYLADMADDRTYQRVGWFADIYHYAQQRFGLGVKVTRERIRIGRALRSLPRIEQAFVTGMLSYSKVRELTRVAAADDEHNWLRLAEVLPTRQLEQRVAGRLGGDIASDQPASEQWRTAETVDVSFRLPARTWALLQRAMQAVRQGSDDYLADAAALEAVANQALAVLCQPDATNAADPRRAVVLYQCRDCGDIELDTGVGAVALPPAEASQLVAGAKVVDLATEGEAEATTGGTIPAAVRRAVLARDRGRCRLCGRSKYVDIHHLRPQSRDGEHSRHNCIVLCSACHRAVHNGKVQVSGDAEGTLQWRDARGRPLQPGRAPIGAQQAESADADHAQHADAPIGAQQAESADADQAQRAGAPIGAQQAVSADADQAQRADAPIGASPCPVGAANAPIGASPSPVGASNAPIGASTTTSHSERATPTALAVSTEAQKVLQAMEGRSGWHPDRLIEPTELDYRAVSRALLELALADAVREGPLGYYSPLRS